MPEKGKTERTNGTSPIPELSPEQAASRDRLATQMRAMGWSPGLCRLAATQ